MGTVRYGTSSWSEKSWVGPLYPQGTAPRDFLPFYATQFDTVEADVTYYRIPDERLVKGWRDRTPPGFVLSAKFPRSIMHCGEGATPDSSKLLNKDLVGEDTNGFLTSMGLLGEKCGPLVMQFPYFNKKVFSGPGPFLDRLDVFLETLPGEFRYAVEIRNRYWLKPALLDLLRQHRVALVLLDLSCMPHPDDVRNLDLTTTDFSYARLIGDRKAVEAQTDTFDRIVLDQSPRIARWANVLTDLLSKAPVTYVYANNHYAGFGPTTIRQLASQLPDQPDR